MGRWVTLEDDQHVYINDNGQVLPRGPGTKPTHRYKGARSEAERSKTAALVAKTRANRARSPESRILENAKTLTPLGGRGYLDELHAKVGGSKEDFQKAVFKLEREDKLAVMPLDNPLEKKRGAYHTPTGDERHIFYRTNQTATASRSPKPLHEHAQEAANAVPASKRNGDKAFLSDVHAEYQKTGGKLSLSEFKQKLADSPEARIKLGMSRNDLNAREDHAKTQASESQAKVGGRVLAEYHFVTTTAKPKRSK